MTNPYLEYYANQAGSGLSAFQGYQYQRGNGFFGSLFQNILKPLGRYLGRQALTTGVKVGTDLLEGEKFSDSIKKNAKITGKNMFKDTIDRAYKFAQTGSGKRRRRRKAKKYISKTIKKKSKTKLKSLSKKKPRKTRKKKKSKTKFSHLF